MRFFLLILDICAACGLVEMRANPIESRLFSHHTSPKQNAMIILQSPDNENKYRPSSQKKKEEKKRSRRRNKKKTASFKQRKDHTQTTRSLRKLLSVITSRLE